MEENKELIEKLTEFETKYRVEGHLLTEFKRIVDRLPNVKKNGFIYVEGPDYYFTNGKGDSFIRYRRPSHGLDNGRAEVTVKIKPDGAKNNIKRQEVNIRVDVTPEDAVREFVKLMGYKPNFNIFKTCHIYNLDDATLVFYNVYDETDGKVTKEDVFVEIEIDEHLVSTLTQEEAMAIISKYEKILEPIGLSAQKRLRKSLFEMYRRNA